MCTNLPAGSPDPSGVCADRGAASCGTNGRCNGAGNCQTYAAGTQCEQKCSGPNFSRKYCDGAGLCSMTVNMNCNPGTCTASGCTP